MPKKRSATSPNQRRSPCSHRPVCSCCPVGDGHADPTPNQSTRPPVARRGDHNLRRCVYPPRRFGTTTSEKNSRLPHPIRAHAAHFASRFGYGSSAPPHELTHNENQEIPVEIALKPLMTCGHSPDQNDLIVRRPNHFAPSMAGLDTPGSAPPSRFAHPAVVVTRAPLYAARHGVLGAVDWVC